MKSWWVAHRAEVRRQALKFVIANVLVIGFIVLSLAGALVLQGGKELALFMATIGVALGRTGTSLGRLAVRDHPIAAPLIQQQRVVPKLEFAGLVVGLLGVGSALADTVEKELGALGTAAAAVLAVLLILETWIYDANTEPADMPRALEIAFKLAGQGVVLAGRLFVLIRRVLAAALWPVECRWDISLAPRVFIAVARYTILMVLLIAALSL